jgi:tRNA dimethylallyltransferase
MADLPTLICILGPTAVGKTSLSISLAKTLHAEIISADSRQMYKDISIGTAKPSTQEMAGVKHHFVDFLELETAYSAGIFEKDVLSIINNSSNKVWLLVGGSGLYVKSIIEGLDDLPSDLILRKSLNERLKKEGLEPLKKELQELDLVHFEAMDTSNPQRIIRALEICLFTGQPYSDLRKGRAVERPFRSIQIVLRRERKILRERIEQRCNQMLEEGWLEECRAVFGKRELNSLNTLGYKELFQVIDGSLEMSEARDKIITETSRFAKRQMTWFRAQQDIHYIDMPDDQALDKIIHLLNSSVNQ